MRVLIACEFSGIVREAFRRRGHDAWSCDLLPAEDGSLWHLDSDVYLHMHSDEWDLMIARPPCTYLTNAGARWLYKGGRGSVRDEFRWKQMQNGAELFKDLLSAPIRRICIENPIPHKHAVALIGEYTQIIHPWQFGHGETKATCLWLKNLPKLVPTNIVEGREARVHREPPGPDRWKNRSRTYRGIADAMAEQWGILD